MIASACFPLRAKTARKRGQRLASGTLTGTCARHLFHPDHLSRMKSGKLFWQRKSSGKSTTDNDDHRGKYKLAETDEDMKDRVEYVLSVHESAEPDSKLQLPTFISPRQRSLLRTTGCFIGACGCLGGASAVLFVMGLANSLDGEEEQVPGADEPTTQVIATERLCATTSLTPTTPSCARRSRSAPPSPHRAGASR